MKMIKLSNSHGLEFVAASGLYGFDGQGYRWKFWEWPSKWTGAIDKSLLTIVTKTLTYPPTRGNYRWYAPWLVVKLVSAEGETIPLLWGLLKPELVYGVANAVGLTGPGFERWLKKDYPIINRCGYKVIGSITGTEVECGRIARKLNELNNIVVIEFNASCTNVVSGLKNSNQIKATILRITEESVLPILIKISYAQKYVDIAKEVEGLIEGISFNSLPWYYVFSSPSPLGKYGGGAISGLVCRKFYKRMLSDLVGAGVRRPIIMPVWNYQDIKENFRLGASACSFGSVGFLYPGRPTEFIRQWREEEKAALKEKSID